LGTACALVLSALVGMAAPLLTSGAPIDPEAPRWLVIQTAIIILSFGFATWVIGRRAAKLTWEDLRWKPLANAGKDFCWAWLRLLWLSSSHCRWAARDSSRIKARWPTTFGRPR
jgi:hypothetical protein